MSLTPSQFFCPSRLSYLSTRRRSELENTTSPAMARINSVLAHCEISSFLFAYVIGLRRPRPDFFTGIVLRVPTMGERISDFTKKRRGNFFPYSSSPLLKINLPYYLWRVVEISTPIGSHVPPLFNPPGDIYPRFFWLCKFSAPTSLYEFLAYHVLICHPRYNHQDNALPRTA